MAASKEVHVFDRPDFAEAWTPADVDRIYEPEFRERGVLRGEATPVYLYLPAVMPRLARYNPALRLIVLLRDPVDRAVSHFEMGRERGIESATLLQALWRERKRLRTDPDPWDMASVTRIASYRERGLYSRQLQHLYTWFGEHQVLVLDSRALLERHEETLNRVFAFLRVRTDVDIPAERVFEGGGQATHYLARTLLRLGYLLEYARVRRYVDFPIGPWLLPR